MQVVGNGPIEDCSPTGQTTRVRRTSMDKPNWGARTGYGAHSLDLYHIPAVPPRTRHLSLSSGLPPPHFLYSQSPPRVVYDESGLTKTSPSTKMPVSLLVSQTPSPPVVNTLAMVLESKPVQDRNSSSPEKDSEEEEEDDDCYDCNSNSMSNLPYAVGKATPFPDGSEAVMIDSALAHNSFQEQVRSLEIKVL